MPGPELFYEAGDSPEALCLLSQALLPSRFLKEIIHYSLKDPAGNAQFSELPLLNTYFSCRCNPYLELALK